MKRFWVLVFLKLSPHSVTQAEAVLLSCGLSYEVTWVCHHSRFKSKHLCMIPSLPPLQAEPGIEPGSWILPHLQYFPLSCIPTIICRGGGGRAWLTRQFLSGMWHSSGKVSADFYTGPQGAQNFDFVDFSVGLVEFEA